MKNTALVITILATLIGTASVSFGDTKKCAGNLTAKNGLTKLADLKENLVVIEPMQNPVIIPNDPRRPISRKDNPEYNAIGALKSNIGRGTAWLGNECLVWTAKHVLGRDKNVIGQKVKFSVGQSSNPSRDFEYEVEGEVVESGNADHKEFDGATEDWALIKLNKSIGKKVGFIDTTMYTKEEAQTCKALEVAGFPGGKDLASLWHQSNCSLDAARSGDSAFNIGCPATPGNSGGPLLCREIDGSLHAIGVVMQKNTAVTRSVALNFTADSSKIDAAYRKHMNTCPQDQSELSYNET